jgi:hypothetical protein
VIEGPGEREDASFAHPPEGRLYADYTAEGRRNPYRPGGIGTKRRITKPRRHGRARAATRATGDLIWAVRIPCRPEMRDVTRRAVGELVGVRLPNNDRPSLFEL